MEMFRPMDLRPRVMVIHRNGGVARFFDGVLRNGCQVELFRNCVTAMKRMQSQSPDLVLCELAVVMEPEAGPFRALLGQLDLLQPPIVLISTGRVEELSLVVRLKLPALDCISQSINPQLLNWKVTNLLSLKAVFDRFRETMSSARENARPQRPLAPVDVDDLLRRLSRRLFSQLAADLPEA
ncbi:MAG: hypothetical protein P8182_14170 [Deltaproteobacteria bacterium]